MGVNCYSIHFRGTSIRAAIDAVESSCSGDEGLAAVVSPNLNGWTSVFPSIGGWEDSRHPDDSLLSRKLAATLSVRTLALTVRDSSFAFFDVCESDGVIKTDLFPEEPWRDIENVCIRGGLDNLVQFARGQEARRKLGRLIQDASEDFSRYVLATKFAEEAASILGMENSLYDFRYIAYDGDVESFEGWRNFVYVGVVEPNSWAEKYFGKHGGKCRDVEL